MNIFTLSLVFFGVTLIQESFKEGFLSFVFVLISLVITLAINRAIFPDINGRMQVKKLLSLVFLVRVIGIFIFYLTMTYDYGTPFDLGGDSSSYDLISWNLAQSFPFLEGAIIPFHARGYYYIGGFLYWVFGHNVLIPRFLNAFAASLTVIFLYNISKRILDEKKARLATYLFIFFPDLIWYSSLQLRDTLSVFLIIFSVWLVFQFMENYRHLYKGLYLSIIIFGIMALTTVRDTAAYLVLLSVIISMLLAGRKIRNKWRMWPVILVMIIGIFIGSKMGAEGRDMLQETITSEVTSRFTSLEGRIYYRERVIDQGGYDTATESLGLRIYTEDPLKKIYLFPVGFLVSWILPYPPWKLITGEEITGNIHFLGSLFWQIILPFFAIGVLEIVKGPRRREIGIETLCFLSIIIVMTISLSSSAHIIGGSSRYRMMYIPFIFIFASYGFFHWKRYREAFPLLAWLIWGGSFVAYLYVKYLHDILPFTTIFLITLLFLLFYWKKGWVRRKGWSSEVCWEKTFEPKKRK